MLHLRIIVHPFEPTELAACVIVAIAAAAAVWLAFRFRGAVGTSAHRELRDTQQSLEARIAEREAEAAMAMELYALLAENATDMVSTHRPEGQYDYATPSWSEFLGVTLEKIIGHLPVEFAHPHDAPLLIANHARGLKSSEVLTTAWRCRRASSGYAWVETTTRPVREPRTGRVQTFVCATRDITDRKRMEDELARSEARFRAALDGSFDAFFALEAARDESGRIVDFIYSELNPRAETLIGRSRAEVLGRRMTDVSPSTADQYIEKFAAVTNSRVPLEEEIEAHAPGAAPRWFHHQIIPLGDGVAVTSRDISDRRHAEEELRALTLVDELTGLYNRRGFRMLAEQHVRLAKRGGPSSMLFCFDLDNFKAVNDVYGHAEGDVALYRVGAILHTAFRDSDIIARLGGDEFAVFAVDCGEIRDQLVNRVAVALAANNTAAGRPYTLSFSMGFARLDPHSQPTLDDLMAEADATLYEVKRRRMPQALSA